LTHLIVSSKHPFFGGKGTPQKIARTTTTGSPYNMATFFDEKISDGF
jgi:hypothetical protein